MESYIAVPSDCTRIGAILICRLGFRKNVDGVNRNASKHRVDIYKITFVDVIVIVCILLLSGGIILKAKRGLIWQSEKVTNASVYHDGKLHKRLKLAEDQEIILLNGKMVVEIKEKKVRVKKSECPRQLCVNTGWIRHTGEAIICVPFKTVIEIKSADAPVVDAVVF